MCAPLVMELSFECIPGLQRTCLAVFFFFWGHFRQMTHGMTFPEDFVSKHAAANTDISIYMKCPTMVFLNAKNIECL